MHDVLSVEHWFKAQMIVSSASISERTLIDLAPFSSSFCASPSAGSYVASTSMNFNDGVWHYASMSYNGTYICVDVDATVRACVHAPGVEAVASSTVVLGATAKSTGYFKGQVDEVSFWCYARTRAEVESDMFVPMSDCNMHWASTFYANGTMYPQTHMAFIDKPPTAYFAFNEGLGGEVSTFTCPVAYVDAFLSIDESGRLALDSSDEPTFGFTPIVPQTASGETVTGSLSLNGAAGSSPEFVPSSVPALEKATVEERVPTLIHIPVSSEDGNEYGACLLESVGSGGQLYFKDAATQGVGEPIPYPLPYPVYLGGKEVYFLPDEVTGVDSIPDVASFLFFACDNQVFYGSDLSDRMMRPVMRIGDFYDTTVAPESTESSFAHQSYVKSFLISVQSLNIAPVACTVLEPCTLALPPEDTLTGRCRLSFLRTIATRAMSSWPVSRTRRVRVTCCFRQARS